jgi:IS30 family transposase
MACCANTCQRDLAGYSQAQLDVIAEKLNNRPRECLDWRTPNEVWAQIVRQNVALNS